MLFLHKANPEIVMRSVYTGPDKFLQEQTNCLPVQQQAVYTEPMQIRDPSGWSTSIYLQWRIQTFR